MSAVKEATNMLVQIQTREIPWASVYAISAAVLTGVFILAAVGFAGPEVLH